MPPLISIILPSYNRAKYLARSIESCLTQTLDDFELIIVDDCSKDNSLKVAQSYAKKDKRIKVVANETNQKLPSSLNIGFKYASGKYFTWISDDNIFSRTALEKMAYYLDKMPEIGLVYADYTLIDDKDKVGVKIYQEPPEYLPIRDCVGACFLYRSSVARMIGDYNEKLFLIEDYEYWLRMGLVTKFFHIKESLYFYRVHPSSLTSTRKEEIRKAKIFLKKKYLARYTIPKKIRPISDLYIWFISDKNFQSNIRLLKTIIMNPIITLTYIFKNLRRLR